MKKILYVLIALVLSASSLVAVPQAIVFDYGGVMTVTPPGDTFREAVAAYIRSVISFRDGEFERVNQERRKAVKEGVTDEEFWRAYAKQKGIKLPPDFAEKLLAVMKEALTINYDMYYLVEQLRAQNIPVAMLSNIDPRIAGIIRRLGLYEPFYPCLLSYEIGVDKPQLKAFKILIDQLGMPPAEIVFIDDNPENIEAAKKTGIDAILFESHGQICYELKKRGALE